MANPSRIASSPEFKAILGDLYDSRRYRTSGEVLKAAWAEYRRRHGLPQSVQAQRYAMRKTAMGMNPRKKKVFDLTLYDVAGKPYMISVTEGETLKQAEERASKFYGKKLFYKPAYGDPYSDPVEHKQKKNPKRSGLSRFMEHVTQGAAMGLGTALAGRIIMNPKENFYIVVETESNKPVKTFKQLRNAKNFVRRMMAKHGVGSFHIVTYDQWKKENPATGMKRRKAKRNPIALYNGHGTVIYDEAIEIGARKRTGDNPSQKYRHKFSPASKVQVIGLKDGSVLLKSRAGRRLWEP